MEVHGVHCYFIMTCRNQTATNLSQSLLTSNKIKKCLSFNVHVSHINQALTRRFKFTQTTTIQFTLNTFWHMNIDTTLRL